MNNPIRRLLLASALVLSPHGLLSCSATSGSTSSPKGGTISVGKPPPSIAVSKEGAGDPDLADLEGKVVIVDFWASWCDPCKEELPELEKLYQELNDSGLEIVGVSVDDERQDMDQFLTTMPLSFTLVFDAEHNIADRWNPPKMPTSYIIDKKGNVALIQEGYTATDGPKIASKVRELLE